MNAHRRAISGLTLYLAYLAQHIKSRMSYRADFVVANLLFVFMAASQILFVSLVFSQVRQVNGWGFWEVLLIYGLSSLTIAVCQCFTGIVTHLPYMIIRGEFDQMLTRPVSPLWLMVMTRFNDRWLVTILVRLLVLLTAAGHVFTAVRWSTVALLTGFFLCGLTITVAINVIFAALAFYVLEIRALYHLYLGDLYNLSYYPLTIYGDLLQLLLTWVFPLAFVSFVPISHLVDKTSYARLAALPPLVAAIMVVLARHLWQRGLRAYESTGS
jgi:ABC-2 type transport system permease protein